MILKKRSSSPASCVMTTPPRSRALNDVRLSAEEELLLSNSIWEHQSRIEDLLLEIPEAAEVMGRRTKRRETTNSRHVDRMATAVVLVKRMRPRPSSALQIMGLWAKAEEKRWTLAMSGYRIAVGEAKKMGGRGLAHEDLVQEGVVGLLDAAKRFDPKRQLRFSTYARWWVRARMMRAIDTTGSTVRLPGGVLEKLRRLEMLKAKLERVFGRWDEEQLALEVGLGVDEVRDILATNDETQVVSLLSSGSDDGQRERRSLEERLSDESSVPADKVSEWAEKLETLKRVVSELPDHHRHVVSLYLGLSEDDQSTTPWTLQSAAEQIGISRERVRQLLLQVVNKVNAELSSEDFGSIPSATVDDVLEAVPPGARCTSKSIAIRVFGPQVRQDHVRVIEQHLLDLRKQGLVDLESRERRDLWSLRVAS